MSQDAYKPLSSLVLVLAGVEVIFFTVTGMGLCLDLCRTQGS